MAELRAIEMARVQTDSDGSQKGCGSNGSGYLAYPSLRAVNDNGWSRHQHDHQVAMLGLLDRYLSAIWQSFRGSHEDDAFTWVHWHIRNHLMRNNLVIDHDLRINSIIGELDRNVRDARLESRDVFLCTANMLR